MAWTPKVNKYVLNKNTRKVGKIVEVSSKWGWFKVKYGRDKRIYEYTYNSQSIRELLATERADLRLRAENAGVTSSWRE